MKIKYLLFFIIIYVIFASVIKANVICKDGQVSPTCGTCRRGCCSGHGGCSGRRTDDTEIERSNSNSISNDNVVVKEKIICNDGTRSASCIDCHSGCCSGHGGCTDNPHNSSGSSIQAVDEYMKENQISNDSDNFIYTDGPYSDEEEKEDDLEEEYEEYDEFYNDEEYLDEDANDTSGWWIIPVAVTGTTIVIVKSKKKNIIS